MQNKNSQSWKDFEDTHALGFLTSIGLAFLLLGSVPISSFAAFLIHLQISSESKVII